MSKIDEIEAVLYGDKSHPKYQETTDYLWRRGMEYKLGRKLTKFDEFMAMYGVFVVQLIGCFVSAIIMWLIL